MRCGGDGGRSRRKTPADVPRGLRLALLVLGALGALALLALGLSAVLDRPAKVVTVSATVSGPKVEVWATLTDFDAYGSWNPVFTHAEGEAREGTVIELDVVLPGDEPETLEAKVLIARPERKLRWQDRLLAPGIRDWEYEFVLEPLDDGRVLVVQQLRIEGLLAPFADVAAAREGLELAAEALRRRLAAATSSKAAEVGSPVRVSSSASYAAASVRACPASLPLPGRRDAPGSDPDRPRPDASWPPRRTGPGSGAAGGRPPDGATALDVERVRRPLRKRCEDDAPPERPESLVDEQVGHKPRTLASLERANIPGGDEREEPAGSLLPRLLRQLVHDEGHEPETAVLLQRERRFEKRFVLPKPWKDALEKPLHLVVLAREDEVLHVARNALVG
jgi:hypothetical protein